MTHIEFSPYHNKHIRFTYAHPDKFAVVLTGVVLDIIKYGNKREPTEYVYIPSNNLKEWKQEYEAGNKNSAARLQQVIDIKYITSAALIQ